MSYFARKEGKDWVVYEEGSQVHPLLVCMIEKGEVGLLVSYLDQSEKTLNRAREKLNELLSASLSGRGLSRVQNEVAQMLRYPGIEGYIKEKFGRHERSEDESKPTEIEPAPVSPATEENIHKQE